MVIAADIASKEPKRYREKDSLKRRLGNGEQRKHQSFAQCAALSVFLCHVGVDERIGHGQKLSFVYRETYRVCPCKVHHHPCGSCGSCRVNAFGCPIPVLVRTNEQTYRETEHIVFLMRRFIKAKVSKVSVFCGFVFGFPLCCLCLLLMR